MTTINRTILITITFLFTSQIFLVNGLVGFLNDDQGMYIENSEEESKEVEEKDCEEKYCMTNQMFLYFPNVSTLRYSNNANRYLHPFIEIPVLPPNFYC